MRRTLTVGVLLSIAFVAPAREARGEGEAQPARPAEGEREGSPLNGPPSGASPEGGAGFPAPDINEEEARGIVNWWSWDYGPTARDPHHKHWPPPFGFALLNFGVFALIMARLAGKPLRQFVLDRHSRIRKDLDEAAHLRTEAEAKLREYEKKVANADAEIEALLATLRNEADAEKERILAAAADQAARIKTEAERQIQAEIARARGELRRGVIEAAVGAAAEILKKQVGADDQRKMAERYVSEIEKTTGGAS
jgi:F-type H+-transporting ATPase subunit b